MGRASQVLVRIFNFSFVNKLFVAFCLPQFEGTESRGEVEKERGEPQADQGRPHPPPPSTDSEAEREEGGDIPMVSTQEVVVVPDEEKAQEDTTTISNPEEDLEIGSLYSHSLEEPTPAIATTQGQEVVYMDPEVLAILPTYMGTEAESPVKFLREFEKICSVQKRPEESSEEDLKLRIISISLTGYADAWFRELEPNSIQTWSEFRDEFFYQFIPAAKTRALRREISEITQGYGEGLWNYWNKYQSFLEECPAHNLGEVEVYSNFYDGMDARSKDLVNSSSGGSFYKLRLSKAKDVLRRLLSAKREYQDTEVTPTQENVKNTPTRDKEILLESRVDKLEEILQSVIQSEQQISIPIQAHCQNDQVDHLSSSIDEMEFLNHCIPTSATTVGIREFREATHECSESMGNTTLYLQPNIVQALGERVEKSTSTVEEGSTQAKELHPMIDESKGCSHEENGPEWREKRSRRRAAKAVDWGQLPPWPELRKMANPPHSEVRPKENKKVLGTYRHHRKKRDAMYDGFPGKKNI